MTEHPEDLTPENPGAPEEAGRPTDPASGAGAPGAPGDAPADGGVTDNLADLKAENAGLADELARANAAYYNLSQEYTNYVRRSKEQEQASRAAGVEQVLTALLGVLDDIALARVHGELAGPLGSMAERFEQALETNFKLERYGAAGEAFDPLIHEALMDTPSEEVQVETIAQVIQPGYRIGEKTIRPARVAVHSPA